MCFYQNIFYTLTKRVSLHRERPNCYNKQWDLNRDDTKKHFTILHMKEIKIRQKKLVL